MKKCDQEKIFKGLDLSGSLRKAVREQKYFFSERDCLILTANYSKTYEHKMQNLDFLLVHAKDPAVKKWAKQYKRYQERVFADFSAASSDNVFRVEMYDEEYCSPTLEAALNVVRLFHLRDRSKEYPFWPSLPATIEKIRLCAPRKTSDLDKDMRLGNCIVDAKGRIMQMYSSKIRNEWGKSCTNCMDCQRPCAEESLVRFPPFLRRGDLVSFPAARAAKYVLDEVAHVDPEQCGDRVYGIISSDMAGQEEESPCIEIFQTEYIRERRCEEKDSDGYYECLNMHDHVEYVYLEKEDPSALPGELYADYRYYLDFLQKNVFE